MPVDPLWVAANPDLPDARARRSLNEQTSRRLGWMQEIFCVNCGRSGGMISKEWAAHVFNLCDDCVEKWGRVPLLEIPEALVRGNSHFKE
jgi:hypothetical protein